MLTKEELETALVATKELKKIIKEDYSSELMNAVDEVRRVITKRLKEVTWSEYTSSKEDLFKSM